MWKNGLRPSQALPGAEVVKKFAEAIVEPGITLRPVVAPRNDVEFVMIVPLLREVHKMAIGGQQAFPLATTQKEIGHSRRVHGFSQGKRIVIVTRSAIRGSEYRAMVVPLSNTLRTDPEGVPPNWCS